MSKKSCKAAESIEDALLRMARVNSNKVHYSSLVLFAYKIDGNRKRCDGLADSSNDRVRVFMTMSLHYMTMSCLPCYLKGG